MGNDSDSRPDSRPSAAAVQVVILAPMPLEMDAIIAAFGLSQEGHDPDSPWTGLIDGISVRAVHVGMGPDLTRAAVRGILDKASPGHLVVDHMMIAGICGGLDPAREVGTLIQPSVVVEQSSGRSYEHVPPAGGRLEGKLLTTEGVHLDVTISASLLNDGYLAVDMESAAMAQVCQEFGCDWSVYRCIGDRPIDGLVDEQIIALGKPDGSGDMDEIMRLLANDPLLADKLEQLSRDVQLAAKQAAEAAVRGCRALRSR